MSNFIVLVSQQYSFVIHKQQKSANEKEPVKTMEIGNWWIRRTKGKLSLQVEQQSQAPARTSWRNKETDDDRSADEDNSLHFKNRVYLKQYKSNSCTCVKITSKSLKICNGNLVLHGKWHIQHVAFPRRLWTWSPPRGYHVVITSLNVYCSKVCGGVKSIHLS